MDSATVLLPSTGSVCPPVWTGILERTKTLSGTARCSSRQPTWDLRSFQRIQKKSQMQLPKVMDAWHGGYKYISKLNSILAVIWNWCQLAFLTISVVHAIKLFLPRKLFLTSRIESTHYLPFGNSVWSLPATEQFSRVAWDSAGQPGLEHARILLDSSAVIYK